MALLQFDTKGIYCAQADVYIDPWRPVKKALITHGHSDHSRAGHEAYLCTHSSAPIIQSRIPKASIQSLAYGETLGINGVQFSFHPAGHILGSAQIRVAYQGEVWVVSGDYKLHHDGLSEPFEPVPCEHFITESTFGLPVYKWPEPKKVHQQIQDWWLANGQKGLVSVVSAYSLGKAQRVLAQLDAGLGPLFVHSAVYDMNAIYRAQGLRLPDAPLVPNEKNRDVFKNALIIAPPAALSQAFLKRLGPYELAMASGWMAIRGARSRSWAEKGFVLSDHADWPALNEAVRACGAQKVYVTHGYQDAFARWLNESGIEAVAVRTLYQGEADTQ